MLPQVPFLFKYAIDGLTGDPSGATAADMPLWEVLPATLLLGYGAARAGSALCNEARNFVFAKVSPCMMCEHAPVGAPAATLLWLHA